MALRHDPGGVGVFLLGFHGCAERRFRLFESPYPRDPGDHEGHARGRLGVAPRQSCVPSREKHDDGTRL